VTRPIRFTDPAIIGVALLLCMARSATPAGAQETVLRGFVDFTFDVADDEGHSQFGLGQLDLFVSSRISEKLSFLTETVVESTAGEFIVEIERLQVTYRVIPTLNISVGRQHTPIGYWSTEYHHGSLLEPTIDRPLMFLFEDEGGVLPIHSTGLRAFGRDIGPASLGYDLMIGNGIGASATEDNDAEKAFTGQLFTQATAFLRVGASVYTDHLSEGIATLRGGVLSEDIRQTMAGPFLAYLGSQLEIQAEYLRIWNAGAQATTTTDAAYFYVGVRFGDVVPYARYDVLEYPDFDPYFPTNDGRQSLFGIRVDLAATAVFKNELRWVDTGHGSSVAQYAAQIAITF
jgi:hypothetical protein